jgi:membrane-bound inhibitor of C-type lysozyme
MGSPWWEQYEQRDTYRCPDRRMLVVERNEAQASLLSGGSRSTLFREQGEGSALRYQSGRLRLILRGDELTLEQLPQRLTCIRTEEV